MNLVYMETIACSVMIACILLLFIFLFYILYLNKQQKKCTCPLLCQKHYSLKKEDIPEESISEGDILQQEYLERLKLLHNYDTILIANAILEYPDTFQNLVEGWAEGDVAKYEGNVLDVGMLGRYLSVLEVFSQFRRHGFITKFMFLDDYDYRLRDILFCKALCTYIANEPALCGLKAELEEMKKRIEREEIDSFS